MTSGTPVRLALRVPASTSNLGPGFDLLGLCLSLHLDVEVETLSPGHAHRYADLAGEARHWPAPPECALFRAFDHTRRASGETPMGLALHASSEIPIGRGFGSSGAAVAAGLLLASALAREPVSRARLVEWGLELEGHPDNSTASLCGGCTLALPHERGVRVVAARVHASIGFALAWPATALSTSRARTVLPREVPFRDAVENPRRLAMLVAGLESGDPDLLRLGEEDRLHVRHRLPLIAGGERALALAHESGAWLATISGSGSGLIALGPRSHVARIAEAMRQALDAADGPACARVVELVRAPPEVVRVRDERRARSPGD
jgi:homoserine kinase